jgi:hypothetical protein
MLILPGATPRRTVKPHQKYLAQCGAHSAGTLTF